MQYTWVPSPQPLSVQAGSLERMRLCLRSVLWRWDFFSPCSALLCSPLLSSPIRPDPTCKAVTSLEPPYSFFLEHEEKPKLSFRSGVEEMTSTLFAVLLRVFYGRNSFYRLIVFLSLQHLQVQRFVILTLGAFLLCLGNGLVGSCVGNSKSWGSPTH